MTPQTTFTALANALIGEPDKFTVSERHSNGTPILVADVQQEFYGRIIGGQGRIIEALRVIVAMTGRKMGKPYALQVPEHGRGPVAERMPFVPNLNWRTEWLLGLAHVTGSAMFEKPAKVTAFDPDDGRTLLRFTIRHDEPKPLPDAAVERALVNVFRAIGNANGRKVNVELKRI